MPHEKWPKYYAFSAHIKPLLEQIDKDSVVQDIGNNQENEELFYNNTTLHDLKALHEQFLVHFLPKIFHPLS